MQWVDSETQTLQSVLLARPTAGLSVLSKGNANKHLFKQEPCVEKIQDQYECFVSKLTEQQVSPIFVEALVANTLQDSHARRWILDQLFSQVSSSDFFNTLYHDFLALDATRLADYLINGVKLSDFIRKKPKDFIENDILLEPLCNLFFTRDTSLWIQNHILIASMYHRVRSRETLLLSMIYRFSTYFNQNKQVSILLDGSQLKAHNLYYEGGDIVQVNDEVILIGHSQRTHLNAILVLADLFFKKTQVKKIVVPTLPHLKSCIHLDMILSAIDSNCFCVSKALFDRVNEVLIVSKQVEDGAQAYVYCTDFAAALRSCLGDSVQLLYLEGEPTIDIREQANCANNLLVLAPRKVISYEENQYTNDLLSSNNIDVITIPSSALALGNGGTHCMSSPIVRSRSTDRPVVSF